jgi:hypothetical protein
MDALFDPSWQREEGKENRRENKGVADEDAPAWRRWHRAPEKHQTSIVQVFQSAEWPRRLVFKQRKKFPSFYTELS